MKKILKNFLYKRGYIVSKINKVPLLNSNSFIAAKHLIKISNPVIFDVGMNHGQTLKKITEVYPDSIIHGFEPSKYCFKELSEKIKRKNIHLNNLAIGESDTTLEFNEYSWDALNSLLERAYTSAEIVEKYDVNVTSIDNYCEKNNISEIHFLKTDTEGFELKVLNGAEKMMKENKIQFIHIELFFNLNFIGQGSVGEIFSFLEKNNFTLVQFSDFSFTKAGIASKSDAFFINMDFNK